MNTNTTHTRTSTIGRAAIATAFAAITFTAAACGTQGTPHETGTGRDRPASTIGRAPISADNAERKYARDGNPARDGFPGATTSSAASGPRIGIDRTRPTFPA